MASSEDESIVPDRITHNVDEIWVNGELDQRYNFLDYRFDTGRGHYRARAYLDEIESVSLFGPSQDADATTKLDGVEIDTRIIDYLKRRFRDIQVLGKNGYETFWSAEAPPSQDSD